MPRVLDGMPRPRPSGQNLDSAAGAQPPVVASTITPEALQLNGNPLDGPAVTHMCEWVASDLLKDWRLRSSGDLQGLGSVETRASEDGSKAVVEVKNPTFLASVTAWSTGMLELITLDMRGPPPYGDPDVVTEQRQLRSHAAALLDQCLVRMRDLDVRSH